MVRSTTRRRWALLALLVAGACDSTGPGAAPATGRYAFEFQPAGPGAALPPVTGTIVLTSASASAIDGVVYARDLRRHLRLGERSQAAYVVAAEGAPLGGLGILNARIEVSGDAQAPSCEGRHIVALAGGGIASYASPCTLVWIDASTEPLVTAVGTWQGSTGGAEVGVTLTLALDDDGGALSGIGVLESRGAESFTRDVTVAGTREGDAVTLTLASPGAEDVVFTGALAGDRLVGELSGLGAQDVAITLAAL